MNLKMDSSHILLFIAKVILKICLKKLKYFSAFEGILDGDETDFEHVFQFYDQVMQGDSSYTERKLFHISIAELYFKLFLLETSIRVEIRFSEVAFLLITFLYEIFNKI